MIRIARDEKGETLAVRRFHRVWSMQKEKPRMVMKVHYVEYKGKFLQERDDKEGFPHIGWVKDHRRATAYIGLRRAYSAQRAVRHFLLAFQARRVKIESKKPWFLDSARRRPR